MDNDYCKSYYNIAPFSDQEGAKAASVRDPIEIDEGEKGSIPDAVEVEEMVVEGESVEGGAETEVWVLVV